jgi:hypothetical protein
LGCGPEVRSVTGVMNVLTVRQRLPLLPWTIRFGKADALVDRRMIVEIEAVQPVLLIDRPADIGDLARNRLIIGASPYR